MIEKWVIVDKDGDFSQTSYLHHSEMDANIDRNTMDRCQPKLAPWNIIRLSIEMPSVGDVAETPAQETSP